MNYLWEAMFMADGQGIPRERIRFLAARDGSAYMEVSHMFLNQEQFDDNCQLQVNLYYRFYDIFKELYQPEMREFLSLRESLTNLILHLLAGNDTLSGMTREEYYKKLLYEDLKREAFGEAVAEAIALFDQKERELILSGLLRQYQTGSSLDIFNDMVEELIPQNIIYRSNENFYEILVYIGVKKEKKISCKMDFLVRMFVDLPYHVDIYYEYHFGILDVEATMRIDEIALC
ncbi:MAG: hypothetical protein ACOCM4_09550 [Acetivibrio ethanolgignens]